MFLLRIATLAGAFVLTANCALWGISSTESRQEFRKSYALSPDGRVAIDNLYGDVRITAWDREEVEVEAVKIASDTRRLNDAEIVVDSTADRLSIHTHYGGDDAGQPASVEYRISVPRRANVEGIRLVNGELQLHGLAGPVKASSINGSITALELEGTADLSTVNGQVEAGFNHISSDNPISLRSVNGPIVLSIPSDSGAQLIAENRAGGIQSDIGTRTVQARGHSFRAILKGGGAPIRLENVNGGISIHSKLSRSAAHPEL